MKVFCEGDTISVKAGEKFAVALNVLGASGYEWHSQECDLIEPLGSEFKVAGQGVGGESQQVLSFKARKAGAGHLHLICKRAWDAEPYQTRSIKTKITR